MAGTDNEATVARVAAGGDRDNLADVGDNTCKHGPYLGVPPPAFHRVAVHDPGRNHRVPARETEAIEPHWADRRAAICAHDQAGAVVGDPIDETSLQNGRSHLTAAFDQYAR